MNETQHNRHSSHGKREVKRQRKKARLIDVLISAGAICLVGILMLALRGGMFRNTDSQAGETTSPAAQESVTGSQETDAQETDAQETKSLDSQVAVQESETPAEPETQEEKAAYIKANPDLYTEDLLELIDKNSETIDFVYDYPEKKDQSYTIDLTAEAQSDTVPLLIQWDEQWGYTEYGSGLLGYTGCGPTTLSMVAIYLTKDPQYTPIYMADLAVEKGYCVPGSGTTWDLFAKGPESLGLTSKVLSLGEKQITNALDEGKLVVINVGPGDFTTTGHYLVITGYTDEGFTVNDPNSRERSAMTWTFERLKDQIKNLWAIGTA
jgi:hypothetical protein